MFLINNEYLYVQIVIMMKPWRLSWLCVREIHLDPSYPGKKFLLKMELELIEVDESEQILSSWC